MSQHLSEALRKATTDTEKANDAEMTAILDDLTKYQDRRQEDLETAMRNAQQHSMNHHFAEQDLKRAQQAIHDLEVLKRAEVIISNRRYEARQNALNRTIEDRMKLEGK